MAAFARDHGGDSRFAGRCAYASALRPNCRARAFNNHGAPNECVYVSCTVLPGVLHTEAVWGNGTTEYSLDALLAEFLFGGVAAQGLLADIYLM